MSQPAVSINEVDGALGVLPDATKMLALVGACSSGAANAPATFARTKDVIATLGTGPLVEAACHYIERYNRPAVLVKTAASVAASPGTLVTTGFSGTSVPTLTLVPNGDYELYVIFPSGGTVGTAGITLQWSLDGGRTMSPVTALGTAVLFAIPGAGTLQLNFAAGTITAGSVLTSRTSAAQWNAADLGAALDALSTANLAWELVEIVGAIDANAFDTIETKIAAMVALGKNRAWVGNTRIPNVGETEAAYKTALDAIFASKATTYGELCAGACKLTSSVSGRKYKQPVSYAIAAREATVTEEVDIADVNLGALVGVSIRDSLGNPDEHDESVNPGLDDSRFSVLRTWDPDLAGVYPNRPRVLSAAGSDFQLLAHRRVMNLARSTLRTYFIRRLNKPIKVNKSTGYILESEAVEIERGADAALRAVLEARPKASGGGFTQGRYVRVSRTDNLLSTKTMSVQARVVPLSYPEFINVDLGFYNPALQVQAA